MAGNKYITQVGGNLTEVISNQTSAGVGDAGKVVALGTNGVLDPTVVNSTVTSAGASSAAKVVALDGTGKIDSTVLPVGIGANTAMIVASEALAAGAWVNVWSNAGAFNVRNATASGSGKQADGFVLAAVTNGNSATVYFAGQNTQVTGQTPGRVYLTTTAGTGGAAAATGAGNIAQQVGIAISATTVDFQPQLPITLAS